MPMHNWRAQKPWVQAKSRLAGHIAGSQGRLAYMHFSAARLHGLHVWNSPDQIHVLAPYGASLGKGAADVVVHHMTLGPDDLVQRYVPGVGTVAIASLVRTVLDCARVAPLDLAAVIADSGLHRGLKLAELEALAARMAGYRGIKCAVKAVGMPNSLAESAGETCTRLMVAQLPREPPERQVTLYVDGKEYRPDLAWRGVKLIVEFDGNAKYFDYATPTDEALVPERERESALMEDGWRFIRIEWRHPAAGPEMQATPVLAVSCRNAGPAGPGLHPGRSRGSSPAPRACAAGRTSEQSRAVRPESASWAAHRGPIRAFPQPARPSQ